MAGGAADGVTTTVAQVATEMGAATAERPDPAAGAALVAALPDDTFAELCGRGGLVVEARITDGAALWRGHPWGTGWTGGGSRTALARLLDELRPAEVNVPAALGLPRPYQQAWGWGWHSLSQPPPVHPGEDAVDWLSDDEELRALVARAFPDAETPPGDPRVAGWFGAREHGRLVAAAAALRVGPEAALLSSLTVDPVARRRGWGSALTAWFSRVRLAEGARVVGLGTYLENAPARALYVQLGMRDVPYVGGVREG
jgi:GNAT superfamily N-acetyltransferase